MRFSDQDCDRIATQISHLLEDLSIPCETANSGISEEIEEWNSKRVQDIAKKENESWALTRKMLVLMDESESASITSWKSFLRSQQASHILPSWPRYPLSKGDYEARLEILLFLATRLQQHRLSSSSSTLSTSTTADRGRDQGLLPSEDKEAGASLSELPCKLSKALSVGLSDEQRKTIEECYSDIQADYERRRQGMRQRLQILQENLDIQETPKQKVRDYLPESFDMNTLLEHFSKPHSSQPSMHQDGRPCENDEDDIVIDRGGRVTESESRINMPEWSTARVQAEPKPTKTDSSSSNSSGPSTGEKSRKKDKR